MSDRNAGDGSGGGRPGRGYLIASIIFAAVFVANVIIGKVSILQGATEAVGFGDIGEFLILFVAVVLFIAACLARERTASSNQ